MRLWHYKLLRFIPRQQLLGQHRECCALRGLSWGKKHSTVDYVFLHHPSLLFHYHSLVMEEMGKRGFRVTRSWLHFPYRGKRAKEHDSSIPLLPPKNYHEHNPDYLSICERNLSEKIRVNRAKYSPADIRRWREKNI